MAALAGTALALCLSPPAPGAVTPTGEQPQPRNIYQLFYGFEHTFNQILKGEELALYRSRSPIELRRSHPELYKRISDNVVGWTDEWLAHLKATVDPMEPKKLSAAKEVAARVNAALGAHFETRGWPYRPMRVIFLPPRMFQDDRDRESVTSGVFIPYYPDAFFASVDWPVPMELLLLHECLHFNALTEPFGARLEEGLTETAARHLVVRHGLLTERQVRRVQVYPLERRSVELVLEEIMERRTLGRDEAIDLFLEAYVTGRQDRMDEILGAEVWQRILALGGSRDTWQTHRVKEILGK